MAASDYMQARESFMASVNGVVEVVKGGEYVRGDHPLVKQNPEKFKPVSITSRWDTVEQATAAPGEHRNAGRRRGRPPREAPTIPNTENT